MNDDFAVFNVVSIISAGNRHHHIRKIDAFHDAVINYPGGFVDQFSGTASDFKNVIASLWRQDVINQAIQPGVAEIKSVEKLGVYD